MGETSTSATPAASSLLDPSNLEKDSLRNQDPVLSDNSTAEAASPAADGEKEQERSVTGIRWLLICVAVFSANLLYGLDNTIVADIQGPAAKTFNEYAELGWLGVGFTLGSVVFITRKSLRDLRYEIAFHRLSGYVRGGKCSLWWRFQHEGDHHWSCVGWCWWCWHVSWVS
jgi:hypothetical protein